jgi:hypothetical protein
MGLAAVLFRLIAPLALRVRTDKVRIAMIHDRFYVVTPGMLPAC